MRVAAIYDIHGNATALEAVLREIDGERIEAVVSGGDVLSGPMPAESLGLLLARRDVRFVLGNADVDVIRYARGLGEPLHHADWVAGRLDDEYLRALEQFEAQVVLQIDGLGETLFCHGTPRAIDEIITDATSRERLAAIYDGVHADVVVGGHTHMQLDIDVEGTRVVNPGSVGMPYEDELGARWAVLGGGIELRRTAYDLDAAAGKVRASGFPSAEDFVRDHIYSIPTRQRAVALFEELAARGT